MHLRGQLMMAIMAEARSSIRIAAALGYPAGVVHANMVRLFHLGIVVPVAIETFMSEDGVEKVESTVWELSTHAKSHKELVRGCFGCKMRERYLAANEVFTE